MSQTIYCLRLENNKYYVANSFASGSAWTHIHPPIDVFQEHKSSDTTTDNIVLEYMAKFGIENVRGGKYSQLILSTDQVIDILQNIRQNKDCCLACGHQTHSIEDCQSSICFRCSRVGHLADNCESLTNQYGWPLNSCHKCGRLDHSTRRCRAHIDIYGRRLRQGVCVII